MRMILFVAALLCAFCISNAQWSDTTNNFTDSLHTRIGSLDKDESLPIVINSYPDGGYFLIWIDTREGLYDKNIYAQKFDKSGMRLWQDNGAPVATGPSIQFYRTENEDLDDRSLSFAATDSAGGFFIAFQEQVQIGSYNYYQVNVQHLKANGTATLGSLGKTVAAAGVDLNCQNPQLIADGQGGFFVSHIKSTQFYSDLYVQCFKDNNGTLVSFGSAQMDGYDREATTGSACGIQTYLTGRNAAVNSYMIYPDLQGGCNVVMGLASNTQEEFTAFNKMARVKKNCTVTRRRRFSDIADAMETVWHFTKDQVIPLYQLHTFSNTVTCFDLQQNVYTVTSYYVENFGLGFLMVNSNTYNNTRARGTLMPTEGNANININVLGIQQRDLVNNNTVGDYFNVIFYRPDEKYDSIPYQLCTDLDHPYFAYRPFPEGDPLTKLNNRPDTVFDQGGGVFPYVLKANRKRIYSTAKISSFKKGETVIYLQEWKAVRPNADSIGIQVNTAFPQGVRIVKEDRDGFGNGSAFWPPQIAIDDYNAVFYTTDVYRYLKVSPIGDGGKLLWGAVGRPLGTGYFAGYPYDPRNAYLTLDGTGNGLVAWNDNRPQTAPAAGNNIFYRHLDDLQSLLYIPPIKPVKLLSNGINRALAGSMTGYSGSWTLFENLISNGVAISESTPVIQLKDDYPLGTVKVQTYQHNGALRLYNGKPFLNRNYTIQVQNNPSADNDTTILVRLYFTRAEFNALYGADSLKAKPGNLNVIKQPNLSNPVPDTYTPIADEITISPLSWGTVDGGYYVEIGVKGFSNFFLTPSERPLAVNWISIGAERINTTQVKVNWVVAQETNVDKYYVQESRDGTTYKTVCSVPARNQQSTGQYDCTVPASSGGIYFFRVQQVDHDGRNSYSSVVVFESSTRAYLRIVPNPVTDHADLVVPPELRIRSLVLFNSAGVAVWSSASGSPITGTVRIPTAQLARGMYYLKVNADGGATSLPLMKK